MKIVVHAGMPKTGSSSIQNTLARFDHPGFTYAPAPVPNHSLMFRLLFSSDDELCDLPLHRNAGRSMAEIHAQRTEQDARLRRALETCTTPVFVLSGERISHGETEMKHRLVTYLRQFSDDIEVVVYLRPPVSFITSAFQQLLKKRPSMAFGPLLLWPFYRERVEGLDDTFGAAAVSIVPFVRQSLKGGDVVTDFADRIGVTIPPEARLRTNDALSRNAVAALFVQRNFGSGPSREYRGAPRDNSDFITAIAALDGPRFRFAPEVVAPILHENADDLDWIERRLDHPLRDPDAAPDDGIASAAQLQDIALTQHDALRAILDAHPHAPPERHAPAATATPLDRLVTDLERLKQACARFAARAQGSP